MVLRELRERGRKDVIMYLHMAHDDAGGNLLVMAAHFGFKLGEDIILPSPKVFDVNQGLPIEIINMLYNTADSLLTTTLGEGWGLSITEAMATRTPVVAPDNTSLHEMLADNRGYLAYSGDTNSMWFSLGSQDNERMRPLMDVNEAANDIEKIIEGKLPDLDGALEWVTELSWKNICKQWQAIFDKAANAVSLNQFKPVENRQQRRAMQRKKTKVGL
jgi:glycosyltransferase involved in cell wall biosynthesis